MVMVGKRPRKSTAATRSPLPSHAMELTVALSPSPQMSRCAKADESVRFPAWHHSNLFTAREKGANAAPQKTKQNILGIWDDINLPNNNHPALLSRSIIVSFSPPGISLYCLDISIFISVSGERRGICVNAQHIQRSPTKAKSRDDKNKKGKNADSKQ
jgi:hypothetical protein